LAAAVAEFSARGFAGARMDAIARRARSNKRMLYHYFGDKDALFRAVLRHKITERRALLDGAPGDLSENLPYRFQMMCRDLDWVRLLGWEALLSGGNHLVEQKFRRQGVAGGLARVRREQAEGQVNPGFDGRHVMLAKLSLAMFPAAFPNSTKLITGQSVSSPAFQREYSSFLKQFAVALRPPPRRPGRTAK
jgi:TetR/AcrR family transcriptional regulator